jgi:Yip1 domain
MLCPACHKPQADNARFCADCGKPMNASGPTPDSTMIGAGPAAASATLGAGTAAWDNAPSHIPGLLQRIKNIMLTPKTEWPVIAAETTSIKQLYLGYIMPLLAAVAVISFIRMSVIGVSMPFGGFFRVPLATGVLFAVARFGFGLLGFYLVALLINALAPTFGGKRDLVQALKTTAYAFTSGLLGSLFSILPMLSILIALAAVIYGIYLLYLGLPVVMKSPPERATGYTVAVVLCTLLGGLVLGALLSFTGIMGGYGSLASPYAMSRDQQQQRAATQVGTVLGALAAAGQKMQQQQAATSAAAPATPTQSTAPADSPATAAAAMAAVGSALSGGRKVDPVDFQTLKTLLPDSLPGMPRTNAEGGSQTAMGVKGSSASGTYQGDGNAQVHIKIADIAGVSGLVDMAGAMVQDANSESDTGYERTTTVDGRLLHEKYEKPARHGDITVIVAKRFAVDVEGEGVDMAALEHALGAVDFARLESMKDKGVQPN